MLLEFAKYQGTGNDFIMINNLDGVYDNLSLAQIQFLCDRKIGIGADGLIKLSSRDDYGFEMDYFNADGSKSFCGNGARCSVMFAKNLGLINDSVTFLAIDGPHKATIKKDIINLEMNDVESLKTVDDAVILDTGSPHFVKIVNNQYDLNIVDYGRQIRYSNAYKKKGINVNLLSVEGDRVIRVSTYERGVEDETLSCGTGVTACALVYIQRTQMNAINEVTVHTKGGTLSVLASPILGGEGFNNIWLSGQAKHVFDGSIEL